MKLTPVVGLQGAIHSEIEQSVVVLNDIVDIVAGHATLLGQFLFDNLELIAIVFVQAVARGNPDEPVAVEIDLTGKTAGKLFVGVEQLSGLGKRSDSCQREENGKQQAVSSRMSKNPTFHFPSNNKNTRMLQF